MLDPSKIKDAALQRLVKRGDASKIDPRWRRKVERIMHLLDIAGSPLELNLPGLGFHELTENRAGTYALWISRNWRITFKWSDQGPFDVDKEDYHGK